MAATTYTTAIQNRVGAMLGLTYSSTSAANKVLIDNTWTSGAPGGMAGDALSYIQQIGQWFGLVAPTDAPGTTLGTEWDAWLAARTALLAAKVIHPERIEGFQKTHDDAEMAAIDAFARNVITYDPGATPEAATLTVQNIRYYVVHNCAKRERWRTVEGRASLRPRLWAAPEIVDSNIERVMRSLWNRGEWPFTRRQCQMRIVPYALTGCRFVHSTKTIYARVSVPYTGKNGIEYVVGETVTESVTGATATVISVTTSSATAGTLVVLPLTATVVTGGQTLTGAGGAVATGGTKTSSLASTIQAGSRVIVTGGTGTVTADYVTSSALADSIVLTETIGSAADGQTDIAATAYAVSFVGLGTDIFRSFSSRELYYDDQNTAGGTPLKWARDSTEMSRMRAWTSATNDTRRPTHFRFNMNPSIATSTVLGYTFDFYPLPDTTYSLRAEVFVRGPALTSLSATTTALSKFPPEFAHVIKDAVLAETLDHYGDPAGGALRERMETEICRLLPLFADVGNQDDDQETRDVYNDAFDMTRIWGGTFGGGL